MKRREFITLLGRDQLVALAARHSIPGLVYARIGRGQARPAWRGAVSALPLRFLTGLGACSRAIAFCMVADAANGQQLCTENSHCITLNTALSRLQCPY